MVVAVTGDKHAIPKMISCWTLIFDDLIRSLEKSTRSISTPPKKSIFIKRSVVYSAVNQHHLLINQQNKNIPNGSLDFCGHNFDYKHMKSKDILI